MSAPATRHRIVRFGIFEVDLQEGELRRAGLRQKLGPQPFQVLQAMLERPGEIVTRDELRERLWAAGTFVDYDLALKKCVNRIREVLGDSADNPRFVETVPRRGYRFIAPVEQVNGNGTVRSASPAATSFSSSDLLPSARRHDEGANKPSKTTLVAVAAILIALIAAVFVSRYRLNPDVPQVLAIKQLTNDGIPKARYPLLTDGARIYFNEGAKGALRIGQVSAEGGATGTVSTTLPSPMIADLAPDGSALLALSSGAIGPTFALWSIPLPAGEPEKLGSAEIWYRPALENSPSSPAFFPDGRIAFTRGNALFVAEKDGSDPRKLIEFARPAYFPRVAPDGSRIDVILCCDGAPPVVQQITLATLRSRQVLGSTSGTLDKHCCNWTPNGKFLVFSSANNGRSDLWALPESGGAFRGDRAPFRLTNGPISYTAPVVSRDGKQIFAVGSTLRGELVRYDEKSREYVPFLGGISATDPTFSRDGKWVAYRSFPDMSLWRSRTDGSDRLQLTYPPTRVFYPFLSHDGTRIVFGTSKGVFIVSTNGGKAEIIEGSDRAGCDDGDWSPDDKLLALGCSSPSGVDIRLFDLQLRKMAVVPGSQDTRGAIWVNQHTLVVAAKRNTEFRTLDLATGKRAELASPGEFVNWWLPLDGRYLYCVTAGAEPELLRIWFSNHHVEKVASLSGLHRVLDPDIQYTQVNAAPDGSALFTRDIGIDEIYALSVKW
jgi:DNA-binding winged helix-turn-helix (wHTH) protein/Tol biopolymer transport system component